MEMDLDNLNDDEVNELIKSLKNPSKLFVIDDINNELSSMFGKIDIDEIVI
jgi:hypothetical protein